MELKVTAYKSRHDYYLGSVRKIAILGYYNVTSRRYGWAGIGIKHSGTRSGTYFNYDKEGWHYEYGWVKHKWTTGADHKDIVLQYGDNDHYGLAWFWIF